jgi:hypothetical protein
MALWYKLKKNYSQRPYDNTNLFLKSTTVEILDPAELERYMEDEDAAYNRIRAMLVELIEQAQTAISQNNRKVAGRVITNYDGKHLIT